MRQLLKRSQFLTGLVNAFRNIPADMAVMRWSRARKQQIETYLAGAKRPRLQIGCGKNILPDWLNCDYAPSSPQVVFLDATAPFPFPDAAFDFIFSEHMIEHVPYAAGQRMLSECHRVLKPGGVLRISTPNLLNIASLMSDPTMPDRESYIKTATDKYIPENTRYLPGFVVNNFYWDFWHYFIYDPETLAQALESAGFRRIAQMSSGVGSVPELTGLECHARIVGPTLDSLESMIFEAKKEA
jgi:SAM-dependent methyltransferase